MASSIHFKSALLDVAERKGADEGDLIELYANKRKLLQDVVKCENLMEQVADAFNADIEAGCSSEEIGAQVKSAAEENYGPLDQGDMDLWDDHESLRGEAVCAAILDVLLANEIIKLPEDEDNDEEGEGEGEEEIVDEE